MKKRKSSRLSTATLQRMKAEAEKAQEEVAAYRGFERAVDANVRDEGTRKMLLIFGALAAGSPAVLGTVVHERFSKEIVAEAAAAKRHKRKKRRS